VQSESFSSRRRYTSSERERLVAQYESSGLTQAVFAQRQDIKLGTFQQWLYRRHPEKPPALRARPAFQELPWCELAGLNCWHAQLQWPNGMKLRLNAQASGPWIEVLLEKLRGLC
jgi:hypothetical protein